MIGSKSVGFRVLLNWRYLFLMGCCESDPYVTFLMSELTKVPWSWMTLRLRLLLKSNNQPNDLCVTTLLMFLFNYVTVHVLCCSTSGCSIDQGGIGCYVSTEDQFLHQQSHLTPMKSSFCPPSDLVRWPQLHTRIPAASSAEALQLRWPSSPRPSTTWGPPRWKGTLWTSTCFGDGWSW